MLKLVHKFAEDQLVLTHIMDDELAVENVAESAETKYNSIDDSYPMEF